MWLNHLVVWGSVVIYVVVALSLYEGVFLGRPDWVSNGGVAFNAATVGSFWFAVAIAAIVCTVPVVSGRPLHRQTYCTYILCVPATTTFPPTLPFRWLCASSGSTRIRVCPTESE